MGKDVCEPILAFYAITGSDTTFHFIRAGKVKIFLKIISNQTKLKLMKKLGKKDNLSDNHLNSAKEFTCSVVYASEFSENYVDTRIRIYKNLKKTSTAISPDPDSVELAIKRAHLQTFKWLRCCEQSVQTFDPEEFGWTLTERELKPVWFNGDQFPLLITRRRKGKAN